MPRRWWLICALLVAGPLCLLVSCKKETPPRTREEIFQERMALPARYFSAKTHQRVIAPAGKGIFVDEETGEICWPALVCNNPDCPGRQGDEPLLFIEPDSAYYVKPDGTVGYDAARAKAERHRAGPCPECARKRDPRTETAEQRQRYIDWVKPYVLPDTAARMKQLDEEFQRRIRMERSQRTAFPIGEGKSTSADEGPQPTPADPSTRPAK